MTYWWPSTFECEACGRVFKYGNRRTQESRKNWRRFVLDRHEAKCAGKREQVKTK